MRRKAVARRAVAKKVRRRVQPPADLLVRRITPREALESDALCQGVLEDCIITLKRPYQRLSIVNARPFLVPLKARAQTQAEWERRRAELLNKLVQAEIDWVRADDRQSAFSFLRCCDKLNLDPEAVRFRLAAHGLLGKPSEMVAAGHLRPKTRLTGVGR